MGKPKAAGKPMKKPCTSRKKPCKSPKKPCKSPEKPCKSRKKPCKSRDAIKPATKRNTSTKRGQADCLTGDALPAWINHLSRVGPSWLFVLFSLCHLLCARVTEVLLLQVQDLDFANDLVNIAGLKKHGAVQKPMSATLRRMLEKWKAEGGQSFTYSRKWGNRGICTYQDTWVYPAQPEEYLFPAKRSDSKLPRMTKDGMEGFFVCVCVCACVCVLVTLRYMTYRKS